MKRSKQLILVCTLATLLIACDANQGTDEAASTTTVAMEPTTEATTPVAVADRSQAPLPEPGQFTIDLTPGNVSIRANQVHELDILESIAAEANFDLLAGDVAWQTVTVDIREDNLHAALAALLNAHPYQIVYTPDKTSRQEVLSEVVISEPLPPVTTAGPGKTAMEDAAASGEEEGQEEEEESELPDPETQAQLQALQNESAEIRAAAAGDIEPTGDALNTLTDLIVSDPSPEVRIAISQALEFSEDPLAIEALVACLKDGNVAVVLECIKALEYIGDSSTAVRLQPLLEHHDVEVRDSAAQAIENLQ
jgi:hypothetical protein